jgi:hypothetical protein
MGLCIRSGIFWRIRPSSVFSSLIAVLAQNLLLSLTKIAPIGDRLSCVVFNLTTQMVGAQYCWELWFGDYYYGR